MLLTTASTHICSGRRHNCIAVVVVDFVRYHFRSRVTDFSRQAGRQTDRYTDRQTDRQTVVHVFLQCGHEDF